MKQEWFAYINGEIDKNNSCKTLANVVLEVLNSALRKENGINDTQNRQEGINW